MSVSGALGYRELPTRSFQRPLSADVLIQFYGGAGQLDTGGGGICQGIPFGLVCPQRWDRGVTSDVPISRVSGPGEEAVPSVPESYRGCALSLLLLSF